MFLQTKEKAIAYLGSSGSREQFEIGKNSDKEINYYAVGDEVAYNLLLSLCCARLKGEIDDIVV